MRNLVKTGLCLASVLVVSMALASTASAVHWLVCLKENSGTTTTKWNSSQCSTAAPSGGWEWSKIPAGQKVTLRLHGTLDLYDTKTVGGEAELACSGESVGWATSEVTGEVVSVAKPKCEGLKVCEKSGAEAEAVNLPWKTELYETEGHVLEALTGGTGGEPGWKSKCKVSILTEEDTCTQEAGKHESIMLENKLTNAELLVLATFDSLRKAKCTKGGAESGLVMGSLAVLQYGGHGLQVSLK